MNACMGCKTFAKLLFAILLMAVIPRMGNGQVLLEKNLVGE